MTDPKPHYARIAAALLADFAGCMAWLGLADGKRQADEWIVRNPTRSDNRPGSFAINAKTGAWGDFATGDKGGDLVALAAFLLRLPMHEAADAAAARLGIPGLPPPAARRRASGTDDRSGRGKGTAPAAKAPAAPQRPEPKPADDGAVFVSPVPDDAPPPPRSHSRWGKPSKVWDYRDGAGRRVFLHYRFEPNGQRKQFSPVSLWKTPAGLLEWRWKAPPEPRPLLGLPELVARPDAPVLIVEGEKARDAAAILAPECVAVTWAGGAQAVGKCDWSPLAGRACLIWPDADEPGAKCGQRVAELLHAAGAASVRLLDLATLARSPKGDELAPGDPLAEGDDAADLIARGWQAGHFAAVLADPAAWIAAAVQTLASADEPATSAPETDAAAKTDTSGRPRFELREDGVYFTERDRDGNEKAPRWIAGPLDILARARSPDSHGPATGWGKLVAFRDPDTAEHRVIVPDTALRGDGLEALGMLMDHGLQVSPAGKRLLIEYLQTASPRARVRVVNRTGWHETRDGARVFVLPDRAIGDDSGAWHYENADPGASPFRQRDKLTGWREHVGVLCVGNTRLVFSVSMAFAAPLLHLVGGESGGCNWRGLSSIGKTSMLRVAVSVFGPPDALSRWRSTLNALESLAAIHCDALLCLDELKMVDPKEAGGAAYTLCNGQGKARAGREGGLRARLSWRLMLLSSGEISLADHVAEAGQRSHAGQEVRLLDLPADAGAGLGCFENLHGAADGAEFARRLDQATRKHYGTAFVAFLDRLAGIDAGTVAELVADVTRRFEGQHLSDGASGQARRVASRFALIAVGGELATKWGITGWPEGEAIRTASGLFGEWLANRGGDAPAEDRQMLRQVRAFLEAHGAGRFTALARAGDDHAPKTLHRAGWSQITPETENRSADEQRTEYFVLPEVWHREVCKGFDGATVARLMHARGFLLGNREADRPPMVKKTIPGEGRFRLFHVAADFMEADS